MEISAGEKECVRHPNEPKLFARNEILCKVWSQIARLALQDLSVLRLC